MIWTAWKNSKHSNPNASYGFKVSIKDKYAYFNDSFKDVIILLPNKKRAIANKEKESFRDNSCRELISKDIKAWLKSEGLIPWPKGKPPKFKAKHIKNNEYKIVKAISS